jgi:hypothetical protein
MEMWPHCTSYGRQRRVHRYNSGNSRRGRHIMYCGWRRRSYVFNEHQCGRHILHNRAVYVSNDWR